MAALLPLSLEDGMIDGQQEHSVDDHPEENSH
jgi:hypothetical protein